MLTGLCFSSIFKLPYFLYDNLLRFVLGKSKEKGNKSQHLSGISPFEYDGAIDEEERKKKFEQLEERCFGKRK